MSKRGINKFNNKPHDGRNNICGIKIYNLRKSLKLSQRALADKLQLMGLDVDKNAIQRIESGQRFITDIELSYIAPALNTTIAELYSQES